MIAPAKKKASTSFPRAKIARVIEGILPIGKKFDLRTADSGIREMKVVRIVTPAWKNLRPPERVEKVLDAMEGQLSKPERDRILRFSVLTPEEYQRVVLDHETLPVRRTVKTTGAKKLVARRKPKGKTKGKIAA